MAGLIDIATLARYATFSSFPQNGNYDVLYLAEDSLRTYVWVGTGYEETASGGIKGIINVAADFPTLAEVSDLYSYLIGQDVVDNDPTKTNTGQSFIYGQIIVWNSGAWTTSAPQIIDGEVNTYADLPSASGKDGYVYLVKSSNITASVNTYADLPAAASHNNEYYEVLQTTNNLIVFNRKPAGIYLSNATTWNWINTLVAFQQDPAFKAPGFYISNGTTWNPFNIVEGVLTYQDVDTDSTFAANSDYKIPSQKAVKSADNAVKLFVDDNYQTLAGLDTSSGYVGLTGYSINFKDSTGARTSLLTNSNTVARTYTFQDRDGTIADNADIAGRQAANSNLTTLTTSTLGDIFYSSALNTLAKLAGNTTTTKKYLTQTGDGANSAAPVWGSFNADVIASLLTGFSASAGTVSASDSILQAFNKVVGNLNALSSPLAGFQISYTNSTQQLSDNTDISWTGRTDYVGLGSQISFSGVSITFASGYKYIVLCSMSAVLYTDPAYKLTWSMRTGGANVGADGILWSNPNGSTNDLGIGGTILGGIYIDTSGGSATYQLRKLTSGAGSSSPTCQGQIIVIAFT